MNRSTTVLWTIAGFALASCGGGSPSDSFPGQGDATSTSAPATPTAAPTANPSPTGTAYATSSPEPTPTDVQATPTDAPSPPTVETSAPAETPTISPPPTDAPTPLPTPSATPTQAPVAITKVSVDLQCGSNQWQLVVDVVGKVAEGSGRFEIFDNTETCQTYGSAPDDCRRELHPLSSIEVVSDAADRLSLTLDEVDTPDDQVAGSSTAFSCGDLSTLTFVACVDDYVQSTPEVCLFFGDEVDYWSANARMSHARLGL